MSQRESSGDEMMHPVETQWHHPIMTKYGFTSDTPPQKGFVRSYNYTHPDGYKIRVTTGVNADHWEDVTGGKPKIDFDKGVVSNVGKFGYWNDLEPHLAKLVRSQGDEPT